MVLHVHVGFFAVRTSIDLCVPAADCEPEVQSRQVPPSRRLRGRARRIYQERTSSTSCRGRREELRRKDGQRHGRGAAAHWAQVSPEVERLRFASFANVVVVGAVERLGLSSERDTPAQGASPRHFGSAARKPESPRARERYAALTRAESLQTRCALSPRLAACAT